MTKHRTSEIPAGPSTGAFRDGRGFRRRPKRRLSRTSRVAARSGMTMLEMIIVVSVGSVIFGSAVASLALLLRTYGADREQAHCNGARQRLAEQFRLDVHAAREAVTPAPDASTLRLTMDEPAVVEYSVSDTAIQRIQKVDGLVASRERFALSSGARVSFDLEMPAYSGDFAELQLVGLRIDQPGDRQDVSPRNSNAIVAALAADHRIQPAIKESN